VKTSLDSLKRANDHSQMPNLGSGFRPGKLHQSQPSRILFWVSTRHWPFPPLASTPSLPCLSTFTSFRYPPSPPCLTILGAYGFLTKIVATGPCCQTSRFPERIKRHNPLSSSGLCRFLNFNNRLRLARRQRPGLVIGDNDLVHLVRGAAYGHVGVVELARGRFAHGSGAFTRSAATNGLFAGLPRDGAPGSP